MNDDISQQPQPPHSHLKQRIIGAIVLVALMIIFVPMLLEKRSVATQAIANLEARPVIKQAEFPSTQDFVQQTTTANTVTQNAPIIASAWIVQLGSFTDKKRADTLVQRLKAQGIAAYAASMKTDKGVVIRVYAGPEVKRTDAEKLQQTINKQFGLNGQLLPFDPLN